MAKIVSTHSYRGGTGKSNVTANLAANLALPGKRVGIVDTDIQSPGIHIVLKMDSDRMAPTLNDYLWGHCRIEEAAHDVTANVVDAEGNPVLSGDSKIFLVPSSIKTNEIARILKEGYDVSMLNDGFRDLLERLELDYLMIDTHPGLNEETLLSIAISDALVLILRPDQQDYQGTAVTPGGGAATGRPRSGDGGEQGALRIRFRGLKGAHRRNLLGRGGGGAALDRGHDPPGFRRCLLRPLP